MTILRNFRKAIHKRGLLGAIAKNAITQMKKWKNHEPSLSEAEIATNIFNLRYKKGFYSKNEKRKVEEYSVKEFQFESLMDFCLASLDIEGNISPKDQKAFKFSSEMLEEILDDLGYKKEVSQHRELFDRFEMTSSKISFFAVQWFEKFYGFGKR